MTQPIQEHIPPVSIKPHQTSSDELTDLVNETADQLLKGKDEIDQERLASGLQKMQIAPFEESKGLALESVYNQRTLPANTKETLSSRQEMPTQMDAVKKEKISLVAPFGKVDSSELKNGTQSTRTRSDFFSQNWENETLPPLVSHSFLVPKPMVEGLMRRKKDTALGVKYRQGDAITNMEGLMHTFVVPIAPILISGDYKWIGRHGIQSFPPGHFRQVLLSASIQPDFEYSNVMMEICSPKETTIKGEKLERYPEFPDCAFKADSEKREAYDFKLKKHLLYYLTSEKRLPSVSEIMTMSRDETVAMLDNVIKQETFSEQSLIGKYVKLEGRALSLEILFNVYLNQLKVEFTGLDRSITNKYAYTIDPPSIFATAIGKERGVKVLNRLQACAFKKLLQTESFAKKLRLIGFNNYADKSLIPLLEKVFLKRQIPVISKANLFKGEGGAYSGPEGVALVLHNNSDAFGQNIETEGPTSMDGVLGSFSNAACILHRSRSDLMATTLQVDA